MPFNTLPFFFLVCCCTVLSVSPLLSHRQTAVAGSAHPQEYILKAAFHISAEPTTRRYSLTVTETTAALDGFLRPVLAINGQIPGPLIEANEGDRLEITVINQMTIPLTMHWHGLFQNGTNWEDGVTGVTQCPIPSNGGIYTYRFNLNGQFGTFWYHSHHQNLMADGINGPMIIHSPRDPLKRSVDFDHDVVLMLSDCTSSDIIQEMLSEAGYEGTPAAPGANSALLNGVGEWNCSLATKTQQCHQVSSPPEFTIPAGEKIRFRLINAGVHAMFFYSVDEHTLNITEADSTGIYGPSDFRHIWLHNGQRYSVIVQTIKEDAGKSFHMRATMDSDCWSWVPKDIQDTAFGILRLKNVDARLGEASKARPHTRAWPQEFPEECLDINPRRMVPILKRSVPASIVGSGRFEAGFGFQLINNTGQYYTRDQAVRLAEESNLDWAGDRNQREKKKFVDAGKDNENRKNSRIVPHGFDWMKADRDLQKSTSLHAASNKRQAEVPPQVLPPFGDRESSPGVTRLAGPPPTPIGTIGKYFMNNVSWTTYPYQPVLHDLTTGGVGSINSSRVANVIYPTAEWYDLYLINIDATGSHPYHLHAMDMHIVAYGKGYPTAGRLSEIEYNTDNPLRRDTVVVPPASFVIIRLHADIPGAWIMHCHIGWHIAGGFAGVVVVQPDVIGQFVIPEENMALCDARTEPIDSIEPGA